MDTAKILKHDAVINLPVGSAFYVRLKELLVFMAESYTEQQLKEFESIVAQKGELTDEWMVHMTTLVLLIRAIEDKAEENGLIVDATTTP